jgi:hypothetical protein
MCTINRAAVPNTTGGLRKITSADDMQEGLHRYHQLDGLQNGSHTDGVQFNPLVSADENSLRQDIQKLTGYLSEQKDIQFKPSPSSGPERTQFRKDLAARSAKYVESSAQQMLSEATDLIVDPAIKALVKNALKTVPKEFYTDPSSSSGRYHPADEINKGGLVLHTCRVVAMAKHVGDYYGVSQQESDILRAGLILHDSCKGGEPWNGYAKNHGDVAAAHITRTEGSDTPDGKLITQVAANHMAQWSQNADGSRCPRPPANKLDQIASYADYIAAQDNIYVRPAGYDDSYLNR